MKTMINLSGNISDLDEVLHTLEELRAKFGLKTALAYEKEGSSLLLSTASEVAIVHARISYLPTPLSNQYYPRYYSGQRAKEAEITTSFNSKKETVAALRELGAPQETINTLKKATVSRSEKFVDTSEGKGFSCTVEKNNTTAESSWTSSYSGVEVAFTLSLVWEYQGSGPVYVVKGEVDPTQAFNKVIEFARSREYTVFNGSFSHG
jgi:hypothetical protein